MILYCIASYYIVLCHVMLCYILSSHVQNCTEHLLQIPVVVDALAVAGFISILHARQHAQALITTYTTALVTTRTRMQVHNSTNYHPY